MGLGDCESRTGKFGLSRLLSRIREGEGEADKVIIVGDTDDWSSSSSSCSQSSDGSSVGDGVGVVATLELTETAAERDGVLLGVEPFPVILASTPADCIRAMASASVSHAMLVPALATRGSATQISPELQKVSSQAPWTH